MPVINHLKRLWKGEIKLWSAYTIWIIIMLVSLFIPFVWVKVLAPYIIIIPTTLFFTTVATRCASHKVNVVKNKLPLKVLIIFTWLFQFIITVIYSLVIFLSVLACKANNQELCAPIF